MEYFFEENQLIKVDVYDEDRPKKSLQHQVQQVQVDALYTEHRDNKNTVVDLDLQQQQQQQQQ